MEIGSVFRAMASPITVISALIFLFDNVAAQSLGFFTPTIIRTLFPGKTVVQQQLLSVPPYLVGAFFTVFWAWLSTRLRVRGPIIVVASIFMITGYGIYVNTSNPLGAKYAGSFLAMLGTFTLGSLCNAWAAANVNTDSAKNGALGLTVFFGNIGGIISTWAYLPSDGPSYKTANSVVMSFSIAIFALSWINMAYIRYANKKRDEGRHNVDLATLSPKQIALLGDRHPAFRYKL